jgi:hypothetical protein
LPLNYFLQRGRPEDIGLRPDGRIDEPGEAGEASGAVDARDDNIVDVQWVAKTWTVVTAVRTTKFWWLAAAYFSSLFTWYAVLVHQTKFLRDIGFSAELTAYALGLVNFRPDHDRWDFRPVGP